MKTLPLLAAITLVTLGASCASPAGTQSTASPAGVAFTDVATTVTNNEVASPRKRLDATLGDVEISVDYGSPSRKDRQLWGALVPYGEVWRTGANEATNIEISGDLMVQGKRLAAGHYAVFTIPTEGDWTVLFNAQPAQWGAYNRDAAQDVLSVTATPVATEMSESMDFVAEGGGTLVMKWGELALPIELAPAH